ncbi:MAG: hypothetical protein AAFR61_19300 [Bacteroidota bacterium]
MNTFLFTWNPKKWVWENLAKQIREIQTQGYAEQAWSVASHKKVKEGDRAFLMRVGVAPKGMVASGFVASTPFQVPHWGGKDRMIYQVKLHFDTLLDASQSPILRLEQLKTGLLSEVNWTPLSSGNMVRPEYVEELERRWRNISS